MAEDPRVAEALAWLEKQGSAKTREEAQVRYGITAKKSYGVKMGDVQALAKALGRDHELAAQLWDTGWYEARLLCAYVDDPAKVTVAQMNRWAKDFDKLGHLRHDVLQALRQRARRVVAHRAVEQGEGRIREAHRVRADGLHGAARPRPRTRNC
jgi:hypothetical protein